MKTKARVTSEKPFMTSEPHSPTAMQSHSATTPAHPTLSPCGKGKLPPRIGLIAGWGRFPFEVAHALTKAGSSVYCLGIAGHVERSIARYCADFQVARLTRMGAHIRYFQQHDVETVTMAGKIHKILFFQRGFLLNHWPDWECVRTFFPHFITGSRNRNDDALLTAAVDGYARHGLRMTAATDLLPKLLISPGQLSGPRLGTHQRQDIAFGWRLAKQMGGLDVGQAVAVKGRAVLAVEAVEGTDECIRRAGMLCPAGGFTVVKVAKPQQDMRFDVPTVGVGTVQTLLQAGAKTLAVEAEKTIIVDQPQVVRFANKHGISIVALRSEEAVGEVAPAA